MTSTTDIGSKTLLCLPATKASQLINAGQAKAAGNQCPADPNNEPMMKGSITNNPSGKGKRDAQGAVNPKTSSTVYSSTAKNDNGGNVDFGDSSSTTDRSALSPLYFLLALFI